MSAVIIVGFVVPHISFSADYCAQTLISRSKVTEPRKNAIMLCTRLLIQALFMIGLLVAAVLVVRMRLCLLSALGFCAVQCVLIGVVPNINTVFWLLTYAFVYALILFGDLHAFCRVPNAGFRH
jgi:hypothetical protein